MYVYYCDEDFESMMTCIYDVWDAKRGSENVRLSVGLPSQPDLFSEYIFVSRDDEKAGKVIRSIRSKISYEASRQIYLAAMTREEDRLDVIYRFLRIGFTYGAQTVKMLSLAPVMRIMELSRKAGNEMHFYRELVRFSRMEPGVYVSHIEPECNITALTAEHFADRMPSEHWMIIDDNRGLAAVHPKDEHFYVTQLSGKELDRLKETEKQRDPVTQLWKEFFNTIGINERKNPRCQRNMFPVHYRKHVTEFMKNES